MIVLLAGILIAQAPPPPAEQAPEIVVVGQKLRRIRLVTRVDKKTGERRCILRRSSGDTGIDAVMCEAAVACGSTETEVAGMERCMGIRIEAIAQRFAASRPTDGAPPLASRPAQP